MTAPHTEVGPISIPAAWAVAAIYGAVIALVLFGQAQYTSLAQRIVVTLVVAGMASPLLIGCQWLGRSLRLYDDRLEVQSLRGKLRTHALDRLEAVKCVVGRDSSCRIAMRFGASDTRRTYKVELSDARHAFWQIAEHVTEHAKQHGVQVEYGFIDSDGRHFWSLRPSAE